MRNRLVLLSIFVVASTAILFAQFRRGNPDPFPSVGQMDDSAFITGVVRTADGHAVNNARVQVNDLNTGAALATAYTHADGSFEFSGLHAGTYEIVAASGLSEACERINTRFAFDSVTLRLPVRSADSGAQPTVSINQLKVPSKAANGLRKARDEVGQGKLDAARQHLDEAIASYPNFSDALTLRGIISMQERKFPEAIADLQRAVAIDPNAGTSYVAMGAAYNSLGQFDDALRALARGTELAPNYWQGYFETARAQLAEGSFEAALAHVSKAEESAPKDFAALHLVKAYALLGLERYSQAIPELEQYLSRDSQSPSAAAARRKLEEAKAFAGDNK